MNKAVLVAIVVVMVGLAGVFALSDDSSAATANYYVTGDSDVVATEEKAEFTIGFYEAGSYTSLSIRYTAALTDSNGNTQSSAVSPSSGSISNNGTKTLTVTAPESAGTYTLTVTFTETVNSVSYTYTDTVNVKVIEPIVLSATLKNNGSVDLSDVTVYFYVDGNLVTGSDTKLSVAAGEDETITYDYVNANLSSGSHTFKVMASDGAYIALDGLGEETTFYFDQGNYDYLNYLMVVFLVIVLLLIVWVVRKPVRNFGKPKARR